MIPVSALGELARSLHQGGFRPDGSRSIPLAAVLGASLTDEVRIVDRFNRECAGAVVVESVEVRAPTTGAARDAVAVVPAQWLRYFEVPPGVALSETLDLLKEAGAFAKLRTGGVVADAFPSPDAVLDFLEGCARRRLPFKATAGLHHPVRGDYRLTYAAGAGTALMYGYLNLIGAAALLWSGHSRADARDVLLVTEPASFRLESGGLRMLGRLISLDTLQGVRSEFVHGFGSCSFREPLDELAVLAGT